MSDAHEPVLRVARIEDAPVVDALMKHSAAAIFPRFYSEQQAESAVRYVAQVDPMLLTDGTFFVLETGGEVVACGGWSRRATAAGSGSTISRGPRAPGGCARTSPRWRRCSPASRPP